MKQKQTESLSSKEISKTMSTKHMCKWFALCNALKFINNTSSLTGKDVEEKDLDYRGIINYIDDVGGDIETCLTSQKGIPFKYSLFLAEDEEVNISDISYEFLDY